MASTINTNIQSLTAQRNHFNAAPPTHPPLLEQLLGVGALE